MQVVIIGRDGPDAQRLRQEHLQAHLEFIESNIDRILVAGPLPDAEGVMRGSLYIIDMPSTAAAEEFIASDPYDIAGVWQEVDIKAFNGVAGKWVGGITW